ncbi:polymer-forming cytoskeletal protein [Paenibacillus sp. SYP-B3998]|uniref:Polymer-forming cytoskeletal protein n=1 Tax=Paenibacillus sp. SYP-B3998 TaxID=2678564 RepID=A0A6G4A053_9BACL|nr:polymer-forming cytoskeletal protein [Paenibacillus sp. SYP-B3998]NEW07027.1 polymer-forming cytoskeletal protein [Paenibacillus sp. SYP-B3998]
MFKSKRLSINPTMTDTLVGERTSFEGRIRSEASIRVEGRITGDIECLGDVIIGEHGSVESNISAGNIVLAGNVQGNLVTKGHLTITSTGSLQGNINAASFIIEEGGLFQGNSQMETKLPAHAPQDQGDDSENEYKPASAGKGGFDGNTVAI